MGKTTKQDGATPRRFRGHADWQMPLPTGPLLFDPALPTAAQLVRGSEVGAPAHISAEAA